MTTTNLKEQCDEMARLFFEYLAIYKQWIFALKYLPKYVHSFAKY